MPYRSLLAVFEQPRRIGVVVLLLFSTVVWSSHDILYTHLRRQIQFVSSTSEVIPTVLLQESNLNIFRPYDDSIKIIYTVGIERTGSTFQQVLLCVIAHLRSDSVSCSGDKNASLRVIKLHPSRIKLQLRHALLCTTVRRSTSEWSERNFTFTEGNIAYTQIYAKFVECPLCEVSKYQKVFSLTDDEILQLTQYMRYWSILRRCCGSQMSQYMRKDLLGCYNPSDNLTEGKIDYHMCGSWNLTAVEKNFVKTKLYSIVPGERLASPEHLKFLWSEPGDCEASHAAARAGVGFNLQANTKC